jgi:hypothetical protein
MQERDDEDMFIPNNDFKYSVALFGVFAIDERPGSSFFTTGTPFSSKSCFICNN